VERRRCSDGVVGVVDVDLDGDGDLDTILRGPAYGFEPWPRRKELVNQNRESDAKP
jgi:hypothetical protein